VCANYIETQNDEIAGTSMTWTAAAAAAAAARRCGMELASACNVAYSQESL